MKNDILINIEEALNSLHKSIEKSNYIPKIEEESIDFLIEDIYHDFSLVLKIKDIKLKKDENDIYYLKYYKYISTKFSFDEKVKKYIESNLISVVSNSIYENEKYKLLLQILNTEHIDLKFEVENNIGSIASKKEKYDNPLSVVDDREIPVLFVFKIHDKNSHIYKYIKEKNKLINIIY